MRSLIQLAGRVRRHRPGPVTEVNLLVLDSNLRALERPGRAAYCKPGFEMDPQPAAGTDAAQHFQLESHRLTKLLARQVKGQPHWRVDAVPRVTVSSQAFHPGRNWVDLEHARMHDTMLPRAADSATTTAVKRAASLAWAEGDDGKARNLWLTGVLPQYQRFRDDAQPRVDVVLLPDEDEEKLLLHRVADGPRKGDKLYVCVEQSQMHRLRDAQLWPSPQAPVQPWLAIDLMAELTALAQDQGLSLEACAKRFATASLPDSAWGWWWHAALGFNRNHGDNFSSLRDKKGGAQS